MAVVKSPKNVKRKKLWIKSLLTKYKNKTIKRNYLKTYSKIKPSLYNQLAHRNKKNLLGRNIIFIFPQT